MLRQKEGGLLAELHHHGVLLETGSLLICEQRGSSCTGMDCIGVSLWPFLSIFFVNEARAGPWAVRASLHFQIHLNALIWKIFTW